MTCPALACINCPAPGSCCRRFALNASPIRAARTEIEVLAALAALNFQDCEERWALGLPLMPDGWRAADGTWQPEEPSTGGERAFTCLNLLPDGSCGDYAHRPGFCADFQPGSDRLCCMTPPNPPPWVRPRGRLVGALRI